MLITALVILLAVGAAALFLARRGAGAGDSGDVSPTASVATAPIRSATLTDVATAYGVVQADPAGTTTLAAPRALIVQSVLVQPGQTVVAGQGLVEVASAPAAALAYRQAVTAASAAQTDLARVQRLFDEHLAASDQLNAARKTLADAQAALAAEQNQGAGLAQQTLAAPSAAVVVNITAAPGDRVAQDAGLVTLARQGALTVKLGLEPSAGAFAVGQPVTLRPVTGGGAIASRLTVVGRATDPQTKTILAVAPLNSAALPIGAGVEAEVVTGSHQGLTVPRAAVVYDETGDHLFVISADKARRVFVTVGRDYGDATEIKGPIAAGEQVAVQGAYELQDGMAVKVAGR